MKKNKQMSTYWDLTNQKGMLQALNPNRSLERISSYFLSFHAIAVFLLASCWHSLFDVARYAFKAYTTNLLKTNTTLT